LKLAMMSTFCMESEPVEPKACWLIADLLAANIDYWAF
jgi:hypothetical protein